MTFEELLLQLPTCPGPVELPIRAVTGGLGYIERGLPEFIGPDVSPSGAIDQPTDPRVMIISAAGAVGKSTLAKEIAHRNQAPIWDLAQSPAVGGNSLTGQITTSFGFALAGQANAQLIGGDLFLLVDALDEARMRANEAGYAAFIANIAEIAQDATGIVFVLLGRTQTAEWTWMLLDEAGVSASLVSIQPFTREQAEWYIEARIQHSDAAAANRIVKHREPFLEARDLILRHLQHAVVGGETLPDEAAREFLGYAPVLEAVAVLLAKEGNYREFIDSLNAARMDQPLEVLQHIITRLLDREQQEKLQANIRPALERAAAEHGWDSWGQLYSPGEQRTRLLGCILNRQVEACPDMPAPVRALYEDKLGEWLHEHPFLREGAAAANKVFESYLFASGMRDYGSPLCRSVEERVTAREYKPSRLLADFYLILGQRSGEQVIVDRQVGILYDSLLAGETDSLRVRMSIEAGDPDEPEEADEEGGIEFELVYASAELPDQETIETRSFAIVGDTGELVFRRQLRDASVVTRGSVSLGRDVDDFEIGPSVLVRCRQLLIHSSGLIVRRARSSVGSEAVVLDAHECRSAVERKPLLRGSLTVCWPDSRAYPWTDYSVEAIPGEAENPHMDEAYRRLRRIVTTLQSRSMGSLAKLRDKIENRRVVQNDMGRALLARLLADGIMQLRGRFYFWVPDRADEYLRSSYEDFGKRRITPETQAYLSRFIAENLTLF